jgi:hypothetical protein
MGGRGRIMQKIEQTNKYIFLRTEKKRNKKILESLYLLELLVVKEDCGRVDKEKGD